MANFKENPQPIYEELKLFINQVDYPCVAARLALKRDEVRIGVYPILGSGKGALQLGRDLIAFKREQQEKSSPYLSFVAVFEGRVFETESEFEEALWQELSAIAARPEFDGPGDLLFSSNPEDRNFCFSLDGSAFFVVGMHPKSSRKSRRFFMPALVFNLYSQFEMLDEETEFYPMVRNNRKRDLAFQGSINTMVEKYAEKWESIQFSGKTNPPTWKCPFHK